jgi:hypothetical protein
MNSTSNKKQPGYCELCLRPHKNSNSSSAAKTLSKALAHLNSGTQMKTKHACYEKGMK